MNDELELEKLKRKLLGYLGWVLVTALVLWSAWVFGLEEPLTADLTPEAAQGLEVLVAAGVMAVSLAWPTTQIIKLVLGYEKQLIAELGKTERRYRTIVERSHDLIFEINEEGKIIFANPAVKMLGYSREQLLGQPICRLLEESQREEVLPRITTRRIGPRATFNCPVTLVPNEDSVLSMEVPRMDFLVDASGLWEEPDEIVSTRGTEKTFLGTLMIARARVDGL